MAGADMSVADPSPREIELLALLAAREGRLEELGRENALLRQKVAALIRRLFGARSERLDPGQLLLLLAGEPVAAPLAPAPASPAAPRLAAPRPRRGPRLPAHLPVVEEVLDPAAVTACPGAWRRVGEEVSDTLDYEPGRFFTRRLIRPKYVARRGGAGEGNPFLIAPLPAGLRERGLAAPGLLAHVLVGKYADHLPLYRQEAIYRQRHGVHLPRPTLARWVELAADWLRPVYEAMRTEVFRGAYVQVDETPVRYLAPGHGSTRQGYLWTYARPGGDVCFDWRTTRAAACLEAVIPATFAGVLQCDGYGAYRTFLARRASPGAGSVVLAGCWAHVRRAFHEARDQSPRLVGWLLGQIGQLYRVEARLRAARAGPRLRAAVRAAESRPVLARLRRALRLLKTRRPLPKSSLGRALDYALGQWGALTVFLGDGRLEIDNNLAENAIRPTAVGKKNWLFVGGADTGQRSAVIYSLIESCRRRGIEPYGYLRDVLTRLPAMTNWTAGKLTPAARRRSRGAWPS